MKLFLLYVVLIACACEGLTAHIDHPVLTDQPDAGDAGVTSDSGLTQLP